MHMFVVEKACLSKCMGEVGMKKEWLYRRVLSGCYISNWEFWDDPQPLRLTNYPWLDDWNWKQLMPGGWKRKLISFILPPHLFRAGGKRDQKKKKDQHQMNIIFHLFAKLYVDIGIENISKYKNEQPLHTKLMLTTD